MAPELAGTLSEKLSPALKRQVDSGVTKLRRVVERNAEQKTEVLGLIINSFVQDGVDSRIISPDAAQKISQDLHDAASAEPGSKKRKADLISQLYDVPLPDTDDEKSADSSNDITDDEEEDKASKATDCLDIQKEEFATYRPLTTQISVNKMKDLAEKFGKAMAKLKMKKQKKKVSTKTFTTKEIIFIRSFLFGKVFGNGGSQQLKTLARSYRGGKVDDLHIGSAEAAEEFLKQHGNEMSTQLREMYHLFAASVRGHASNSSVHSQVKSRLADVKLVLQHETVMNHAMKNREEYKKYLMKMGCTREEVSRPGGNSLKTLIQKRFAESTGNAIGPIKAFLEKQRAVHTFVKEFGWGVVVLLPNNTRYLMRQFGIRNLRLALECFNKVVGPEPRRICDIAKHNCVDPIQHGVEMANVGAYERKGNEAMTLEELISIRS